MSDPESSANVQETSKDVEEDSSCPICLCPFENKSYLERCFHTFCFYCILQWSEIVRTCPLCKSEFTTIIHTVKSDKDYQMYQLSGSDNNKKEDIIDDGSFRLDNRFRYRTTMTSNRSMQRQGLHSNYGIGVNRNASSSISAHWGSASARKKPVYLRSLERRRAIYAASLWVKRVESNGKTKYRDISPEFFRRNPACTHRLIPWISRELKVVLGNSDDAAFVRQLILSIINKIDIQSDELREQLSHFLYEKTDHFLHEFVNFARSPYDMFTYDRIAQYDFVASGSSGSRQLEESESPTEESQSQTSQLAQMSAFNRTELDDSPLINHEISSNHSSDSDDGNEARRLDNRARSPDNHWTSARATKVREEQGSITRYSNVDELVPSISTSEGGHRRVNNKSHKKHRHHSRHKRRKEKRDHKDVTTMGISDITAELQRLEADIKRDKSQLIQVMLNIESFSNEIDA